MSDTESAMRQRIKILIDELEGGVQRKFAQAVGVHPTTINEILGKRQNQPSAELLQKIAAAYPQLLMEWLIRGKGQMLKPAPGQDAGTNSCAVSASHTAEQESNYESGEAAQQGIWFTPTFEKKGSGLGTGAHRPAAEPEPVGADLVRQIAINTAAIRRLQEQMKQLLRKG